MQPLVDVGLVDLLESDPRPTFVVCSGTSPSPSPSPRIAYTNPSLSSNPHLLGQLAQPPDTSHREAHETFWKWTQGFAPRRLADATRSHYHLNLLWTRHVVKNLWIVVSANEQPPSPQPRRKMRFDMPVEGAAAATTDSVPRAVAPRFPTPTDRSFSAAEETSKEQRAAVDIEMESVGPTFPKQQKTFLDVIHGVDWASTPLGPMSGWPPRLHQTFFQVVADSRPIALCWGPRHTTIYNEAFSRLCGSSHPALLGKPLTDSWLNSATRLEDAIRLVEENQSPSVEEELTLFVRDACGRQLETYLKWSVIPIIEKGTCLGMMHPVTETTSMRLWERRMKMLIELGEGLVVARDVKSYWNKVLDQFSSCDPAYDVPLAILYSVEQEDAHSPAKDLAYDYPRICNLEGTLGVPAGHGIAPQRICLNATDTGLSAQFRAACHEQHPVLVQTKDGSLPSSLLEGLNWRGFGDPCEAGVICSITPTKEENIMGFLFLGLNPRRPYDNDYRQYISLLNQKLTTHLASTVLLEKEARRRRTAAEQAALDKARLKEKLALSAKEASESHQRFQAVAEFVPVGMCFGDTAGNITFANDAWYRITGHPKGVIGPGGFFSRVLDEDLPSIREAYSQLENSRAVTFEFRIKGSSGNLNPANAESGGLPAGPSYETLGRLVRVDERVDRHVLASAKAERAPDGTTIHVLTCLTDVTTTKQMAEEAIRRAQEAENLKRMAEFATVGMYGMSLDGRLVSANNVFYELCGLEKVDLTRRDIRPWAPGVCVAREDIPLLHSSLDKLVETGKPQTAEVRMIRPWIAEDSSGHRTIAPRWALATFMPVIGSDGHIWSVTGCLSDVSLPKWQLERERKRKEEAIESKRQQENFIDMTSHEMRNPLGAIFHCADTIVASLSKVLELQRQPPLSPANDQTATTSLRVARQEMETLVNDTIENAETIVACAQHQKRIVDDILTMSKLDSKLLTVTPFTVDAVQIVQESVKMFEIESRRDGIQLTVRVDDSYRKLGRRFLDFDASRVKQVLINLLTNALKFTKTADTRCVSVTIMASENRPTDESSSVRYIPRSLEFADGQGKETAATYPAQPVYLTFEVRDTGRGLTEDEMRNLFNKFRQGNSRTHVQYGGSGLGLFISKRLTELQNGAIGVSSLPGVGSTFAFFIESYVPSDESRREAEVAAMATATGMVCTLGATTGIEEGLVQIPSNGIRPMSETALKNPAPVGFGTTVQKKSKGVPPVIQIPASGASSVSPTVMVDAPAQVVRARSPLRSQHPGGNTRIDGILIVEDNVINQQITRRGLDTRGYSVEIANHGIEALEKLGAFGSPPNTNGHSSPFNLILMDIEMPVQDGLTCTRTIRDMERSGKVFCASGGRIPIIAVSANARAEQIEQARAAGCDDVLVKPYRMPELIERMQLVVRRMGGLTPPGDEDLSKKRTNA